MAQKNRKILYFLFDTTLANDYLRQSKLFQVNISNFCLFTLLEEKKL